MKKTTEGNLEIYGPKPVEFISNSSPKFLHPGPMHLNYALNSHSRTLRKNGAQKFGGQTKKSDLGAKVESGQVPTFSLSFFFFGCSIKALNECEGASAFIGCNYVRAGI